MLDYSYWQSAFSGDPDVVGQALRVGGRTYTVIGVGAADFAGTMRGIAPAFYAPYMMVEALLGSSVFDARGNHSIFAKARLRPGVTLPQAEAAVGAIATQLTEDRIDNWDPAGQFVLLPLTDVLLFPPMDVFIRASAWLLMVAGGLVLLLACTNLTSFLLARALDRRKDIAVRLALGASRASLVRRLLTETTLLSLLAGGVGIALAVWLLDVLVNLDLPLPIPITLDLGLDWNVLAFTLGISVVAGTLLGLVPAIQSTRPDLATTLKSESAGGGQPGQLRCRNALVITQLTVSLVLLVGGPILAVDALPDVGGPDVALRIGGDIRRAVGASALRRNRRSMRCARGLSKENRRRRIRSGSVTAQARVSHRTMPRRSGGIDSRPSRGSPARSSTSASCMRRVRISRGTMPRRRGGSGSRLTRGLPTRSPTSGSCMTMAGVVPEDDAAAVRWYRLAAEQGDTSAQFNLGVMYADGQGVPQDCGEAHMWLNLAAAQSSGENRDSRVTTRDAVAALMTAEQIAEAQRRAREWTPTPEP